MKYSSMRELIRAEAREEGIEKSIEQGRQEVILKLLKADMSVEKVSEITGLSKQEIRNFQDPTKGQMKQGLFVIRATRDSGEILNKKDIFEPQAIKQIHPVK